jgi:hypothetical protein
MVQSIFDFQTFDLMKTGQKAPDAAFYPIWEINSNPFDLWQPKP